MLDIFLLEQLDAFAKTGTLSRAAELLHITQPALSRNMKKLESLLGVALFDRQNSKIALNETGRVAARYARQILDADQQAVEMIRAFDRSRRTVSLGTVGTMPVSVVMSSLQERFPDKTIAVELGDEGQLLSGLRARSYQLAIFCRRPPGEDLVCRRLLEERLAVSVPADHPLAVRGSVSFADLDGINIITAGNTGFWVPACERHIDPRHLVIQYNLDTLKELAESSSLPLFCSDRMLERGYDLPGRVALPVTDDDAHVVYHLACLQQDEGTYAGLFDAVGEPAEEEGPPPA